MNINETEMFGRDEIKWELFSSYDGVGRVGNQTILYVEYDKYITWTDAKGHAAHMEQTQIGTNKRKTELWHGRFFIFKQRALHLLFRIGLCS